MERLTHDREQAIIIIENIKNLIIKSEFLQGNKDPLVGDYLIKKLESFKKDYDETDQELELLIAIKKYFKSI